MKDSIWSKIGKYVLKPGTVMGILGERLIKPLHQGMRTRRVLLGAKVRNVRLSLGTGVVFVQNTIISGKGKIRIEEHSSFGYRIGGFYHGGVCELQARYEDSEIIIGRNTIANNNLLIICARQVIIGKDTLIGEGVMIIDHDAHGISPESRRTSIGKVAPIEIGTNVWIGSRATILPGTSIGDNCIVGAGAIVKGKFPSDVIIAGNPARVIREIKYKQNGEAFGV